MAGCTGWDRGEGLRPPSSVEEFMTDVDTAPNLPLEDLDALLVDEQNLSTTDPEKFEMDYQGKRRTITGVVRVMREQGSNDSADLLEDLINVGKEAKQLVAAVRKKATGSHSRPVLKKKT